MRLFPLLIAFIACWTASGQTYTISTFAGGGLPTNIPATSASVAPVSVAVDSQDDVFLTDTDSGTVMRVDAKTGVLTVVAGNGTVGFSGDNGLATSAQLYYPYGIAVDSAGNLYIADSRNNVIRRVSHGVITTVAGNGTQGFSGDGGPAISAQLNQPYGIAVDSAGNLYITDRGNNVRRVSNGIITTVAGNGTQGFSGDGGPATSAQLNTPGGITVDSVGNLYIADSGNNRIREVANGVIATLAPVKDPVSLAVDSAGTLYFTNCCSGVFELSDGVATIVLPGNDQIRPSSVIAFDSAGNLYVAASNSPVFKVSNGVLTIVAGGGEVPPDTLTGGGDNGPATSAQLQGPVAVAVDSADNVYISDLYNGRVRKVANGVITTVAGGGSVVPGDNGPATSAMLYSPWGHALDSAGNLYIADTNRLRKVSNGIITTVAGNGTLGFSGDGGPAASAELNEVDGVAVDSAGDLYVVDSANNRIRRISNGVITTIAGNGTPGFSGDGGPATSAALNQSQGMAVDSAGNLFIADVGNNVIRKVSNGVITTVAGGGQGVGIGDGGPATSARLQMPFGVALGSAGRLYVTDMSGRVRLLTPSPGTPEINPGGIVPNDSTSPTIQSGSWISIYGSDLASGTAVWTGNFPTSLSNTSVNIDNKQAYVWYVSPTQINLHVPDDNATGTVSVAVTTLSGTATSTVTMAAQAPTFSLLGDGVHVAGEIATTPGSYDLVGPSNTFSYSTRPVKAGETLSLYGVGFGPTTPHVPAGQVFSGSAPTNSPVTISIGGVNENVTYAGITEAGLYQFNLVVLPGTPSGDQPVLARVNGVQTPAGPVVTVQ